MSVSNCLHSLPRLVLSQKYFIFKSHSLIFNTKAWQSHIQAHTFDLTTSTAAGTEGAAASLPTARPPPRSSPETPSNTARGPSKQRRLRHHMGRSCSDRQQETPALSIRSSHSATGSSLIFDPSHHHGGKARLKRHQ